MSGKPKRGLDFAGWNVDIFENDTKIDELIDAQGWIGFSIYFYLCMKAYASEGYYYRWSYANAATTARRMGGGIGSEAVKQCVSSCLQIGLFDKRLFVEEEVLTSKGIQRRYRDAIQKRSCRTVDQRYWLLDAKESEGLVVVRENGDSLPEDAHSLPEDVPKSKGKESKVKERESTAPAAPPPPAGKKKTPVRHKHGEYGWVKLTDEEYQRLLRDLGPDELARCIRYVDESAQGNGNRNRWSDWNLVLRKCHRDGWGLGRQSCRQAPAAPQVPAKPNANELERLQRLRDQIRKDGET